jgi:hypothetical protein
MGILVSKPGAYDGLGNQLIARAKTCYLLQTQVPRLEFGTWRNPIFLPHLELTKTWIPVFLRVPSVSTEIFLCIVDTEILLAERIHVRILGHAGRIMRSYLHNLYDHDIQAFYRDDVA